MDEAGCGPDGARDGLADDAASLIHIGTSGWQYRHWRPAFYPAGLPQTHWLGFYAERFATVESNNAFYRLPERLVFEAWAARTPDDFRMAVKVSRYLTHILRLREPDEPVARFTDRISGLGSKLAPVLLQLPPTLEADIDLLGATLERFPARIQVAVEFRHASWFTGEVRRLLESHQAVLCLADRSGLAAPLWRTADWGYVRFHQGRATPQPCYGETALLSWAQRLQAMFEPSAELFAYFNNDHRACAIRNAVEFGRACRSAGLRPTRLLETWASA